MGNGSLLPPRPAMVYDTNVIGGRDDPPRLSSGAAAITLAAFRRCIMLPHARVAVRNDQADRGWFGHP